MKFLRSLFVLFLISFSFTIFAMDSYSEELLQDEEGFSTARAVIEDVWNPFLTKLSMARTAESTLVLASLLRDIDAEIGERAVRSLALELEKVMEMRQKAEVAESVINGKEWALIILIKEALLISSEPIHLKVIDRLRTLLSRHLFDLECWRAAHPAQGYAHFKHLSDTVLAAYDGLALHLDPLTSLGKRIQQDIVNDAKTYRALIARFDLIGMKMRERLSVSERQKILLEMARNKQREYDPVLHRLVNDQDMATEQRTYLRSQMADPELRQGGKWLEGIRRRVRIR